MMRRENTSQPSIFSLQNRQVYACGCYTAG
jgi:hypothetical protein